MKVILFSGDTFSFTQTIVAVLKKQGHETAVFGIEKNMIPWKNKLFIKLSGLPNKIRNIWEPGFLKSVNTMYLEIFYRENPDIVLIYNDQMLFPESIREMKKKAKVGFYLGDSPFFITGRDYNVATIMEGDYIFSPDTYWIEQLKILGCKNISHVLLGFMSNPQIFTPISEDFKKKYSNDIVFIGGTYGDNKGYKRALFLNKFKDFDFKLYGNSAWNKWFYYFPELKKNFIDKGAGFSDITLNNIIRCSKIYPVDANPGIIHGIHLRVLDCIYLGVLPITEYRKDLFDFFGEAGLPIVYDYNQAAEIALYFLANEKERLLLIDTLRNHLYTKFSPELEVNKIINLILS